MRFSYSDCVHEGLDFHENSYTVEKEPPRIPQRFHRHEHLNFWSGWLRFFSVEKLFTKLPT
jgi:hypothetical protein